MYIDDSPPYDWREISLLLYLPEKFVFPQYILRELSSWSAQWKLYLQVQSFTPETAANPLTIVVAIVEEESVPEHIMQHFSPLVYWQDSLFGWRRQFLEDAKNRISDFFQERIATLWETLQRQPWCRENFHQQAFAYDYARQGSPQHDDLGERVRQYLQGTSREVLAICGQQHTYLLARLYRDICERGNAICHFVDAGSSYYLPFVLQRVCWQLQEFYGIAKTDISLRRLTRKFRHLLAEGKELILILDSIDRLEDSAHAHYLYWLPGSLPARVKIIVGCGPGEIQRFLCHKTSEIVHFPEQSEHLFDFEALEKQYDYHTIQSFLCLLCCSRCGMRFDELCDLVPQIGEDGVWQAIWKEIGEYLFYGDHLLRPHRVLKKAVSERYLTGEENRQQWHHLLAKYFEQGPLLLSNRFNMRKLTELLWQQSRSGEHSEWLKTVCTIDFLEALAETGLIAEVLQDYETHLQFPTEAVIHLITRVLRNKGDFLQSYPQTLFQTLWNYGYWHEKSPFREIVEVWRTQKKRKKSFLWLKSLCPLPALDCNLFYRPDPDEELHSICYCPRGDKIATGKRCEITLWSDTGEELFSFVAHNEDMGEADHREDVAVESVCFDDEGLRLASSSDYVMRVWDAYSGTLLREFVIPLESCEHGCFSTDGRQIAYNDRGVMHIWDAFVEQPLYKFKRAKEWEGITCFSAYGKRIASGAYNGLLRIWNQKGRLLQTIETHTGGILHLEFSRDGRLLASSSDDDTICLWDATSRNFREIWRRSVEEIHHICFSRDSRFLASASKTGYAVWETATGEIVQQFPGVYDNLSYVCFHPREGQLLSVSSEGVHVWPFDSDYNIRSHTVIQRDLRASSDSEYSALEQSIHKDRIKDILFSPDGKKILSQTATEKLLWDAASGALLCQVDSVFRESNSRQREANRLEEGVYCRYDGKWIAYVNDAADLWDAQGKFYETVKKRKLELFSVDRAKKLLHSEKLEEIFFPFSHQVCFDRQKSKIAFLHDGIEIWDLRRRERIAVLPETINAFCYRLYFNGDGSKLISTAGLLQQIFIWDIEKQEQTFEGEGDTVCFIGPNQVPYVLYNDKEKTNVGKIGESPSVFFAPLDNLVSHYSDIIAGSRDRHLYLLQLCEERRCDDSVI